MPSKIIKLGRKDDLTSVIRQIKSLRERDVIFEIETGSSLLTSSEGMKLMKKTGEVLGKTIKIETTDETGRILAKKAGVLAGEAEAIIPKTSARVNRSSDIQPRGRFSDIKVSKRGSVAPAAVPVISKKEISSPEQIRPRPQAPRTTVSQEGSRMAIVIDRGSSKFSKIFILSLVVLVAAVFGLAVLLPKTDITVFARSEPITRDFELTIDRSVSSSDSNSLQVPGIPVSKEVSVTQTFNTTGIKVSGTKTGGTVSIFNNTPNTLKFNAKTTTLVANGKKYFLTKDISGIKAGGVANEGIAIAAENGGAEYNMPANMRFQIVNAALGNADVYAQNPQALGGGSSSGQTKILSQTDLDNATNILIAGVIAQAQADMTAESGNQVILLDSGVKKEVLAKTPNKEVGDETDTFSMTLIAKVTGLAFKEDNVISVLVSKINEVLSSDKYLLDTLQKQYTAEFKSIDTAVGKGVLSVHFETVAAYKVETQNLPKILAGKNEMEIKEILLSKPEIDSVQVKFWPEWFVNKAPKFNGKINVDVQLTQN